MPANNWSLERRLMRRMFTAYAVIALVTFMLLLCGLGWVGLFRETEGEWAARAIAESLHKDQDGKLALVASDELSRLDEQDPEFWFIVRDESGGLVSHGLVPGSISELLFKLSDLSEFDRISFWSGGVKNAPSARLLKADSTVGKITILVRVGSELTVRQLIIAVGVMTVVLALPFAMLTILVAAPIVSVVIRRTLRPLGRAAEEAHQIDVRDRKVRLRTLEAPREITPLIEAINAALDRLEQGYDRQSRFLADAAHELRTPVAILQTRLEGVPESPLSAGLRRDAARLAGLAEQLLALQRLESTDLHREPVDLTALARAIAADFAPVVIARQGTIGVEQIAPAQIAGDRLALERALINLVQNAIDHGGPNIVISISSHRLEVQDDGPGVPDIDRNTIFEPFSRLKPRHTGAGLGLALVRQIVHRHEGHITAAERAGGGLVIRIEFPPAIDGTSRSG